MGQLRLRQRGLPENQTEFLGARSAKPQIPGDACQSAEKRGDRVRQGLGTAQNRWPNEWFAQNGAPIHTKLISQQFLELGFDGLGPELVAGRARMQGVLHHRLGDRTVVFDHLRPDVDVENIFPIVETRKGLVHL